MHCIGQRKFNDGAPYLWNLWQITITNFFQTGKGVPVLVPQAWRQMLSYLVDPEVRRGAQITPDNKYIFAASRKCLIETNPLQMYGRGGRPMYTPQLMSMLHPTADVHVTPHSWCPCYTPQLVSMLHPTADVHVTPHSWCPCYTPQLMSMLHPTAGVHVTPHSWCPCYTPQRMSMLHPTAGVHVTPHSWCPCYTPQLCPCKLFWRHQQFVDLL